MMSKWQDVQIKRAVKIHADAPLQQGPQIQFYFTPAQARLAYWGMHCLRHAIRDSSNACALTADYADDIRCHADAEEWSRGFMNRLGEHATQGSAPIVQEGVVCH